MAAIVSLLVVVLVSLLVTRVAAAALVASGLSRDIARFQARSAFSGVGFTTGEAESLVCHPFRRRVLMWLMLLGTAGVATTVASLLLSFFGATGGEVFNRALALIAGLIGLRLLAGSRWFDHLIGRAVEAALRRWSDLDVHDYAGLLQVAGPYAVAEITVREDSWLHGHRLGELRVRDEGVVVLGLYRTTGAYVGVPGPTTALDAGDRLVVYGREERLENLAERPAGEAGDRQHAAAVEQARQEESGVVI